MAGNGELSLDARLEAARARASELSDARAARESERKKLAELEQLEREVRESEALEMLEAEHGPLNEKIRAVHTPAGMIVVKRPAAIQMRRYNDAGKTTSEAYDKLVRPCVLYPDKAELNRIFDDYPASLNLCADAVCWLAGFGRKELEGKSES